MVTGAAPFQGRRVGDTLANAKAGRYTEPEGLSAAAKDFLACMLSVVSFGLGWVGLGCLSFVLLCGRLGGRWIICRFA